MKDNNFYVYRYIRLDTNTPFYVGKGRGKRAFDIYGHNDYCINIIKKFDFKIEFILKSLTENQAFSKEKEFIKLYKKYGFCKANLTLGGQGSSGIIMSEVTKRKMSLSHKGKIKSDITRNKLRLANIGKKHSEKTKEKQSIIKLGKSTWNKGKKSSSETKLKISKAHLNKPQPWKYKKIQCIETGEIFDSLQSASKSLNIPYGSVSDAVRFGHRNRKTGLSFRFIAN